MKLDRLSGRDAVHVLRVLAIARERDLPLLPALLAAADVTELVQARRVVGRIRSEEDVVGEVSAALTRGEGAAAGGSLAALARASLPASGLRALADWLAARARHRLDVLQGLTYPCTLAITGALLYSAVFHSLITPAVAGGFRSVFEALWFEPPALWRFYEPLLVEYWRSPLSALAYFATVLLVIVGLLWFSLRLHRVRVATLLPIVRQYLHYEAVWSFSRTLQLVLSVGVPLPEAVRFAADTVTSQLFRRRLLAMVPQLEAGEPFGELLRASGALPTAVAWRLRSAYYRSDLSNELDAVVHDAERDLEVWRLRVHRGGRVIAVAVALVALTPVWLFVVATYGGMFSIMQGIG
jgi:type II secretory pathway component PulF